MKVEEILRDTLATEQRDVARPDVAHLRRLGDRRRHRRHRATIGLGALVLAVGVLGSLLVSRSATDDQRGVVTGPVSPSIATTTLPSGEQTGPIPAPNVVPDPNVTELSAGSPLQWFNARTGYNDRQLVVSFIGTELPVAGQDNPCAAYYTGTVESFADLVTVSVVALQPTGGYHDDRGCKAVGHMRSTTINLPEPLDGRPLYDMSDPSAPRPVTGGATLAYPTYVPDGYVLESERLGFLNGTGYWGQTYTTGEPMPWQSDAELGASDVAILRTAQVRVAGGADPVLNLGNAGVFSAGDFSTITGQTVVHGKPAEVRTQFGVLGTALVILWPEGDSWYGVSSLPNGPRNATLTLDELQRVAESMRVA